MASSGSFTTTSCEGRSLTFSWSIQSQSIANNTTTISWDLKGSGSYTYGWVTCGGFKVIINGSTVYSQSTDYRINVYSGTTVASGTHTISHNSDGSKTFSASAEAGIYTYAVNCSGSGSWALTTIPRASSFGTISGNTIGGSMTVNINRNSSSFTHQLWYKLGNSDWYEVGKGIGTQRTFTISEDLLSQLPSTTSGTLELCVRTYNGSTQIGSDVYKNVTVYVSGSVVPSLGTITLDPVNITTRDGVSRNILVQGKNKLTVSIFGCTAGTGSSIKSYTFSGPGISSTTTATSVTTSGTISNTGSLKYTVTVTDSRGRTASKSATITCYAYTSPDFTSFTAYRANSDGTANPDGKYLKCTYGANYNSVNNTNNITVSAYYITGTTSKKASGNNGNVLVNLSESSNTYQVHLEAVDNYNGRKVSEVITVFGSSRALNVSKSGTGVAIGKLADQNEFFDVRWKSQFRNDVVIDGNLIATGVQKVTEFYTGSTAGTIQKTLASGDSIDNYQYLEILYTDNNNNGHGSTKIYSPNGRKIDLSLIEPSDTTASRTYIRRTMYTVAGDSNIFTITPSATSRGYVQIDGTTITQTATDQNYIKIVKILGYK